MVARALVTGAGARIGRAMALYLGARGVAVAVHYHTSRAGAEAAAAEIGGAAVQADLLDEAATAGLVGRAAEVLGGPLDLLVNNASVFELDTLATATRESWDRHIGSNLRAPVVLTQAFAAQAPAARTDAAGEPEAQAQVVNMVDQMVLRPTPRFMSYTLGKAGLWAFTQTAARTLAPDIRVNAIAPGPTMQAAHQSAAHFAGQRRAAPLQRGAGGEDITAALGYLLGARAVTGEVLCVDGGQHLAWATPDTHVKG